MTISLRDLTACFQGVIPSIIATAASDGTPNISYLSHVALIDDHRVALSNQFFRKTAANIKANPNAALLLVDPRDGRQFRLDICFEQTLENGELFEDMAAQLRASAQLEMGEAMRLRSLDIYSVRAVQSIRSSKPYTTTLSGDGSVSLKAAATIAGKIAHAGDVGAIIDAVLDGVRDGLAFDNAIILLKEPSSDSLVTVGSRGYERSGVGSEVLLGDGVIGTAALTQRPVRINDASRIRRFSSAVQASLDEENRTRTIALPGMGNSMSQVALPMTAHGVMRGVFFVESARRLAFTQEDQAILAIVAMQAAAALALAEAAAAEASASIPEVNAEPVKVEGSFRVVRHAYDDSVFIDNEYLIKGLPGRILMHLLRTHQREGRQEFTNREIRLAEDLRLPDFKDNLETRLLLLRRRLEEKSAPVQIFRTGRGRIRMAISGKAILEDANC
mgnify:CR=1 FL=1